MNLIRSYSCIIHGNKLCIGCVWHNQAWFNVVGLPFFFFNLTVHCFQKWSDPGGLTLGTPPPPPCLALCYVWWRQNKISPIWRMDHSRPVMASEQNLKGVQFDFLKTGKLAPHTLNLLRTVCIAEQKGGGGV